MKCSRCGSNIKKNSAFCPECGNREFGNRNTSLNESTSKHKKSLPSPLFAFFTATMGVIMVVLMFFLVKSNSALAQSKILLAEKEQEISSLGIELEACEKSFAEASKRLNQYDERLRYTTCCTEDGNAYHYDILCPGLNNANSIIVNFRPTVYLSKSPCKLCKDKALNQFAGAYR